MLLGVLTKLKFFESLGMKRILVSCSGGADSMALLHTCKIFASNNDMNIRAIHINHNAQKDNHYWSELVKNWCDFVDVDLISEELNIKYKSNFENAARLGRQGVVSNNITPGEWLLTGHHSNDQAESIIMALARAGGHSALSGLDEISEINGYLSGKPMLGINKDDIYKYCSDNDLDFVEDPTNKESIQDRNFVRNEVIPLLEKRWPDFVNSANTSASLIKKLSNIINSQVDTSSDNILIKDLSNMSDLSSEKLRIWLKKKFGKSAGNNIINQIVTLSKSKNGHVLNNAGFHVGVWNNTVWDLRIANDYLSISVDVKYKHDLDTVCIGGVNKKVKKVFKEFGIPPWERETIPFFYDGADLVAIGNQKIRKTKVF